MKKFVLLTITVCMLLSVLCGCSSNYSDNGKLEIVTTIFPEYDWVSSILGEKAANAELKLLTENGVDMHSYQPSTDDVLAISKCDVFVYVGGESDTWTKDALKNSVNKDMKVINLMEILGQAVKEEELKEGMTEESSEENNSDEKETDEHVWMSLKNAEIICKELCKALSEADSENKAVYEKNTEKYIEQLTALDKKYEDTVKSAKHNTLVFADRFPFRYLTDDYSLDYFAAFPGCSAETEASFKTISFLSGKVDELKLGSVMTIDGSDQKIAQTVRDNTKAKNQKILSLDSMQSVNKDDISQGTKYISVMEKNLDVLKEALN